MVAGTVVLWLVVFISIWGNQTAAKMGSTLLFSAARHWEIDEVSRNNPGG
jgi:hypothetical protein